MRKPISLTLLIHLGLILCFVESLNGGSGLYRDGIGGAALSKAGAVVARPDTPIESISTNPAGLALSDRRSAELSMTAAVGTGRFTDRNSNAGALSERVGALGDLGVVYPLPDKDFVIGVASYFQSALRVCLKNQKTPAIRPIC